ncbi:WD-40 repeat protein [Calothrix sp. NIES-4071]|nr:WD-40 repeat protein [Calothrix sp. NIES-4071]BAZ62903.1 WD-40 repeat protein [Calothrix sp. NIES-4105]
MNTQIPYEYIYSGTLNIDSPTYTKRKADTQLYENLKAGKFCYVFNSRKTGKSSLRVQIMHRLQKDGIACAAIDLSMNATNYVTPDQWYADIIDTLIEIFHLDIDLDSWWLEQELLSPVKRFSKFIDILLAQVAQNNRKIVIFIDEIDSLLSLKHNSDDFFALIRACYNQRADNPIYNNLTFCLLGVTTPSDLMTDKTRTPFNIGEAIELTGFTIEEVKSSLAPGLSGKVSNPEIVLQEVLNWTYGQPFLTQKVCNYLVKSRTEPQNNAEAQWVEEIIRNRIITNWESQDEPEHLQTILNRIISEKNEKYRSRLLGLYQRILLSNGTNDRRYQVVADESAEQVELRLSGLVAKSNAVLKVYNRIYELVFDWNWAEKELAKVRPYAYNLTAWFDSNCQDESRLLRGQALRDATSWAMSKCLGDRDYQFLAASKELEKRQAEIALAQEKKARELEKLEYEVNLEIERKGAEAQKQANNILRKATNKANRRIRIGGIILVSSLLLSLFVVTQAEHSRQNAVTATYLEQDGTSALQDFKGGREIDGLLLAMQTGQGLKTLVKSKQSLVDYPAYSPVFSLQKILLDIHEKNRIEGHTDWVRSIVYSPDGNTIASASNDKTIKLWNGATGKLISTLVGHQDAVISVVYSPDGNTIASASVDKTIKLWDVATGKIISTLTGHTDQVNSVVTSPDSKTLASASNDNTIKLWNVNTSKEIGTLTGHKLWVSSVVYSPDGKTLASASGDNTIKLWDVTARKQIATLTGHKDLVSSIVYSPDGNTIASASDDRTIKLWDGATGKEISTLAEDESSIKTIVYSPDGKSLVTANLDGSIKLWNVDTRKQISTLNGHQSIINSIVYSPDGKTLASASDDQTIKLWDVGIEKPTSTLTGHKSWVTSVAYSPDGNTIASASEDKTIKLWDASTKKLISTLQGHTGRIWSAAYSPDSKTLASASRDNTIKLWNVTTGKLISTLTGHTDEVNSVAYSPDGKTLASASWDKTIKLWNGATGKEISTLIGHQDLVRSIVYSPDGNTIASASNDKTIKLWNGATGKLISTLIGHKEVVTSVVYSPDGKIIASAGNKTIKLWDGATGKEISTLTRHKKGVLSIAFSPDGKILVSASNDKTIKLWNVATGKQISTLTGHTDSVWSIAFSPDGNTIASASGDDTIKLWNLDLDNLLAQGCDWLKGYFATRPEESKDLCFLFQFFWFNW